MSWHPQTYLTFVDHRTRPAHDLAARIPLEAPRLVCDLGCGPGNSTRVLEGRWPDARLIGVDSSQEMLDAARTQGPKGAKWQLADVAAWSPDEAPDLIFSNALFQWVANQRVLLPRLCSFLAPGGVLAIQLPVSNEGPPHTIIDEVLSELGLAPRIPAGGFPRHVLPQADYYRLLVPMASWLDIWDARYLHVLEGEDAVLRWIRGASLVPILAALDLREQEAFVTRLARRLTAQYPPESDGRTLFPFRRRFIVAVRA